MDLFRTITNAHSVIETVSGGGGGVGVGGAKTVGGITAHTETA